GPNDKYGSFLMVKPLLSVSVINVQDWSSLIFDTKSASISKVVDFISSGQKSQATYLPAKKTSTGKLTLIYSLNPTIRISPVLVTRILTLSLSLLSQTSSLYRTLPTDL